MSAPGQRVSVVIPTHNRARFVGDAIRSVLAQRERPREVIVVDDCSEDETPELLGEFGEQIRVVRTEANVERGAARNLGASLASGEALAFLDSDDVWHADKLERQLAAVPPSLPSVTGVRFIDESGRDLGKGHVPAPRSDEEIVVGNCYFGSPSTMVVPKLAFEEVGGFPVERSYQGSEDWIFLVKLLWAGWPIEVVRRRLAGYRLHPGGWTQNPENLERSMWAAYQWLEERHLSPPRFAAARRGRVATSIACAYLVRARRGPARRWGRIAVTQGGPAARLRNGWRLLRSAARGAIESRASGGGGVRRRVVLFTPGHTEPGGAQRRSRLIAEGLRQRGWEVKAIARAGTLRRPALRSGPGLTVVEVPGFGHRRLGAALFGLVAVPLGLVWGRRASALVSVQLMSTTTAAGICGLLCRRPFLAMATTDGGGELDEIGYLAGTRLAPLRFGLLRRASCLLAQTEAGAERLASVTGAERVAVLPNPVHRPAAAPPLPETASALYAGRFAEEKDLPCLLRAWREVVRQRETARLTLLGGGGAYRSVEMKLRETLAADPALRESVRMPGWAPDVERFLRATDAFVLPSREEGMSNALLEACAWGRVVVASDIPSNRAVLGNDYPLLFPPGNARALAERLGQALDPRDPVRGIARETVRERVRRFSTDAVITDLEGLIDAACRSCD